MSRKSSRRKTLEKKRNPYLRVFKLYLPSSKWKFDGHFPKDIIEESDPNLHVKGKLWWIKQKIRTHTYFKDQIEPITRKYIHPEGFCVFPPLATSRLFNNVYDNLTDLYKTEFPRSSPQATQFEVNGYDYKDTMKYFREHQYNSLANLTRMYVKFLCELYDVPYTSEFIQDHMNIGLLRYGIGVGLGLHIDNFKANAGPIITISIGPEFVYYDMTPTLLNNKKAFPLRFCATQGSVMIMDGMSRLEWAHGLPYKVPAPDNKIKYTIFFKCYKFRNINPHYSKILSTNVTSSGVVC